MLEVRAATSDEDLGHIARIVCTVSPGFPTSLEEMHWSDEKYPGGRRFLAWLDGIPVGSGWRRSDVYLPAEIDRPAIPAGGFAIGLEAATARVIGYASLMLVPGASKVAWHGMTAVARQWRGRGLATALKRATIAWAGANGLEALETANDIANAPMRAVNSRLGYWPLPDEILVRGSVVS